MISRDEGGLSFIPGPSEIPTAMARQADAAATARYDEGEAFYEQHKWDGALASYRAAVDIDPEMSEAWHGIAAAEFRKNGGTPCEAMYEPVMRCIALDPDNADAHQLLGAVRVLRGDLEGAEESYLDAKRLDPHCAVIRMDFAVFLHMRGRLDDAIDEARECIRPGANDSGTKLLAKLIAEKQAQVAARARARARARPPALLRISARPPVIRQSAPAANRPLA